MEGQTNAQSDEAVRTPIPRGIEVLVKKASVDAEFKALLLEKRAAAAREIGLELAPAEVLMLNAVPPRATRSHHRQYESQRDQPRGVPRPRRDGDASGAERGEL